MKRKKIILLSVILAGTILCYSMLLRMKGKQEGEQYVTGLNANEIVKIEISYPDGEYLEAENRDGWVLVSPEGIRYSEDLFRALPLSLAGITADKTIEDADGDYIPDTPVCTITAHTEKKETVIEIGNQTASGEACYFRVNGKVYTMRAGKAERIMLDRFNVLDPYVLSIDNTLKLDDAAARISDITFIKDGTIVLTRSRDADGNFSGADGELCEQIAEALVGLRAERFEKCEDKSKIGLFPATAEITYTFEGKPETLLIGNRTEGGYYACVKDRDPVFVFSASGFEFLHE